MPDRDADLLARLNALKTSSIVLDSKPDSTYSTVASEPAEDIAKRFLQLHTPGSHRGSSEATPIDDDLRPDAKTEDDKSFEELLAELGTEDEINFLDPDEPKNIQKLLKEANEALPPEPSENAGEPGEVNGEAKDDPAISNDASDTSDDDEEKKEKSEDVEATEYLKKVLDEIEADKILAKPETPPPPEDEGSEKEPGNTLFELPSTPQTDPVPAPVDMGGLHLPSAPSFAPASKAAKAKSSLPTYSDKDIDTWCEICNDDATIRCRGCNDELYCARCWKEGHIGSDVGYENKMHRWVKYEKPK